MKGNGTDTASNRDGVWQQEHVKQGNMHIFVCSAKHRDLIRRVSLPESCHELLLPIIDWLLHSSSDLCKVAWVRLLA